MSDRVVINTPGIRIKIEGGALVYPSKGRKKIKKLNLIKELRIYRGVLLSSDVILKALENDVIVIFAHDDFEKSGIVLPVRGFGTIKTQREQIRIYDTSKGTELLKAFAKASVITRVRMLRKLMEFKSGEIRELLKESAREAEKYIDEIDSYEGHVDKIRQKVMLAEAKAGDIYYKTIAHVIPEAYGFKGKRTRRPPKTKADAVISYLSNRVRDVVLEAIIAAGLHPYFGFLHADEPRRMSLVLDLAEEFIVPLGHAIALRLMMKRKLEEEDFRVKGDGSVFLNSNGRVKVEEIFLLTLRKKIKWRGMNTTVEGAINHQAKHLAAFIRGDDETYNLAKLQVLL